MSVLETIRKRAKLLVGLIGAALVIFVLEDALTSGRFFFGGSNDVVATVNGKKIKYQDFRTAAEQAVEKKKMKFGVENLRDSIVNATETDAFNDMVFHAILDPQYKKLGINVSDSELHDLMLGSYPVRDVYEFFSDHRGHLDKQYSDPRTGRLNMGAVVKFLQQANDQQQMQWSILEEDIKNQDLQSKYYTLLIDGLFVPDAMAKQIADNEYKNFDISYVVKKYADVPDNSVSVSDQDIKDYYDKHLYEYYQEQESRKLDYVTFYCNPTYKDLDSIKRQVDTLYASLNKEQKMDEDSTIIANSDAGYFDKVYHKKSELSPVIDSIMTTSKPGTIFGPYKEDSKYKIAKLMDTATLPDSIQLSAIILQAPNGDSTKIKPIADSLKAVATPDNFAALAQKYTSDPTSREKGGDLGWFYRNPSTLQPDIDHFAFFGNKGDITMLKETFGYIICYIADQGEKNKCYQVGIAEKNILPSQTTRDSVYALASSFSGKNHNTAGFEKMSAQMNRRVIDVGENDRDIGLESTREVLRWTYDNTRKEGDVSDAMAEGESKYIVLHVMQITERGNIPLAQVKEQIKQKALDEKKADKIMGDMNAALQGASGISAVGQKISSTVSTAKGLTFESSDVPKLGNEDALIGTMSTMNTGATSKAIKGELGVYVIHIDSTYYPDKPDDKEVQQLLTQTMRNKAVREANAALIKEAGLVNHLGRFH